MIRMIAAIRTTLITTAFMAGVPTLLVALGGNPLPDHAPSAVQLQTWLDDPLHRRYVPATAWVMAWLIWALLTAMILTVWRLQARRWRWARLTAYLPGPVQGLAATLLGAATVTTTVAAPQAEAAAPVTVTKTADTPVPAVMPGGDHQSRADAAVLFDAAHIVTGPVAAADAAACRPAVAVAAPAPAAVPIAHIGLRPAITVHTGAATTRPVLASTMRHETEVPAWASDAPGGVHRVKAGDNLWKLAEDKLGDPHRWREIYTLNRGHQQANGYALTDPDEIHIGWVLALPAPDTTSAQRPSTALSDGDVSKPGPSASTPAPHTSTTAPEPAATSPEATTPSTTPAATSPSAPASPAASATASQSAPATTTTGQPRPPAGQTTTPDSAVENAQDSEGGISVPSHGWVSLGLAGLIAAVASLLRLQRRRHARLGFPIPARLTPRPTPMPACLAPVDSAGTRRVPTDDKPHHPVLPAPIGLDPGGAEVSLFDLPGRGLALTGIGAEPAARAILTAALATGVNESIEARPVVVTTTDVLARLLPAGAPPIGLDPDQTSFDGERLIVLDQVAAAVTHAEEEMIVRRRLLDTFDIDSITALNARTDHAEAQPPYVVLVEATTRHAARLLAVSAHRTALHLHPVILGPLDGFPTAEVAADGTVSGGDASGLARLSTLTADDLAAVLSMLTDAAARPEPGHDIDLDPAPTAAAATAEPVAEPVPAQNTATSAPVRLRVLGPLLLDTPTGLVATGMRSGSYTVLASLAVHPSGRTLEQLAADLHPNDDLKAAGKRIRTDISTLRKVLRTATGDAEAMFVNYDAASGRYTIDADLIAVDLWQMLTAIDTANNAADDTTALTALREAADLYTGDFADGKDQTWISDHATTYRHQILAVYARIAEITEPDHPDQAVAALERALELDPVNEELYQRIMRIHGRAGRFDAVRRTLHRLEDRLADLGDTEPSEATRRVAERQLRPAATGSRGPR